MAAILEDVLGRRIEPKDLLDWVAECNENVSVLHSLEKYGNVRSDFVPYFLNFLRDQTTHLVEGCKSTHSTPAKTPASLKLTSNNAPSKNSTSKDCGFSLKQSLSASSCKKKSSQLFGSTINHKFSRNTLNTSYLSEHCSNTANNSLNTTVNQTSDTIYDKNNNSGPPRRSYQQNHNGHKSTTSHRSKRRNFGDFMHSPDAEQQERQRRSPRQVSHRTDRSSPVPGSGQKLSYKPKSAGSDKHGKACKSQQPAKSDFHLMSSDFPAINDAQKSGIPPGATVITASRRINTTLISQDLSSNSAFTDSPFSAPFLQTLPRSVWAQPPDALRKRLIETGKAGLQSGRDDLINTYRTPLPEPVKKVKPRRVQTIASPVEFAESSKSNCPKTSTPCDDEPLASPEEKFPKTISVVSMTQSSTINEKSSKFDTSDKGNQPVFCVSPSKTPVKTKAVLNMSSVVTPIKLQPDQLSGGEVVTACIEQVTHQEALDMLVKIYVGILKSFLVPNLTVELYFIIQLLTAKNGDRELLPDSLCDIDEVAYFTSVHNAVYFAVNVLIANTSLLKLLDRSCLHLLLECQRVKDFSQTLQDEVSKLHECCCPKPVSQSIMSPIGGVPFLADTDNRKNFPTDRSFHAFKKQRDDFYELLRDWEEHHLTAGWKMEEQLAPRVLALIARENHLANHIHLTRLFQSQLIQMCKGDVVLRSEDENNVSLLSHLKHTNPEKLKRLQERFTAPSSVGGPCPPPSFPGCQEFFQSFIIIASNSMFNFHLSSTMASKIIELNSSSYKLCEDGSQAVDSCDQTALLTCLITLKLLGKFLGLVHFLPYQQPETLPESIQSHLLDIRNRMHLSLDIAGVVVEAEKKGQLCVTLPWVIDYLSMMDSLAPVVTYFRNIFSHLLNLHRKISEALQRSCSRTLLLLMTTLGWLFQLSLFPEELFYGEREVSQNLPTVQVPLPNSLDSAGFVDENVLHSVCPYLGELRNLLVTFSAGLSSKQSTVKKITPISTDFTPPSSAVSRSLQNQLEENFFHQHPSSMRSTVDFIADRVASNSIKYFRQAGLPSILAQGQKRAGELAGHLMLSSPDKTKMFLRSKLDEVARELKAKTHKHATEMTTKYCQDKVKLAMRDVLYEETSEHVVDVASSISSRMAQDKVHKWLMSHMTFNFFKKDLQGEFEKQIRLNEQNASADRSLETSDTSVSRPISATVTVTSKTNNETDVSVTRTVTNSSCPGGFFVLGEELFLSDVLVEVKDVVQEAVTGNLLSCHDLCDLVSRVGQVLTHARHQHGSARKCLIKLTQELAYTTIFQAPHHWRSELSAVFYDLWKNTSQTDCTFSTLLCPKHLLLLTNSPKPQLACQEWKRLISWLGREGFVKPWSLLHPHQLPILLSYITAEDICDCITSVFHSQQHKDSQALFSSFLTSLAASNSHITDPRSQKVIEDCITNLESVTPDTSTLPRNSAQDTNTWTDYVDKIVIEIMDNVFVEIDKLCI